jgi:hypothetical protein
METAVKVGSLATTIALAVGVLYNVGYFFDLGLNFLSLLSYKDYLTSLLFIVAPSLLVALLILSTGGDIVVDPIVMFIAIVWFLFDLVHFLPQLYGPVAITVAQASLYFFMVYLPAVMFYLLIKEDVGPGKVAAGVFLLSLLLAGFTFAGGNYRFHVDAAPTKFETQVTLDLSKPSVPAHLVRVIDGGMLMIFESEPGRITFLRKEDVKIFSVPR